MNEPQWQALRFCSRCGTELGERLVHGRMRPACSVCGFVVYTNPKVACGALLVHDRQLLLVRRRHEPGRGRWCMPCGFAEADEPPEQAVCREMLEETSLVVHAAGLLGVYHYTDDPRGAGLLLVFRVRCDNIRLLAAGDDADDVGFFSPTMLPPISHHTHQRAIDDWLAGEKGLREGAL